MLVLVAAVRIRIFCPVEAQGFGEVNTDVVHFFTVDGCGVIRGGAFGG